MLFYKYQGAGNDFVIMDNRDRSIQLHTAQVHTLCDRHFGIGADGLMLLENADNADFKMVYYNADGNESTMCGNGGRCIAAFAHSLGITGKEMQFEAIDGLHHAIINDDKSVSLQMQDVTGIRFLENGFELDTGSPHYVQYVKGLEQLNVFEQGRLIRNGEQYQPKGINVNFVEEQEGLLHIRTYERGVEDETLACGTGVTAAAIVSVGRQTGNFSIPVQAVGGHLLVTFTRNATDSAAGITLTGGADFVFRGTIEL